LMNMLNRKLFKGLNISEQFQPTPKPCEHACAHASHTHTHTHTQSNLADS
jgi:hypothetical protein